MIRKPELIIRLVHVERIESADEWWVRCEDETGECLWQSVPVWHARKPARKFVGIMCRAMGLRYYVNTNGRATSLR